MTNKRQALRRTILGSLFLLGAILLSACSGTSAAQTSQTSNTSGATPTVAPSASPTGSDSVSWQKYTAKNQFTINYPSTWQASGDTPFWTFFGGSSEANKQAVSVTRNETPVQDPQALLTLALPLFYGSGCKPAAISQVTINGAQYATMTPSDCVGTATVTKQVLYVHMSNSPVNFVFGCQTAASTYSTFEQTYCLPMISSFHAAS